MSSGWGSAGGEVTQATTIVLLRHGVTEATERRLFSGTGGADLPLTEVGASQAAASARWIRERFEPEVLLTSPLLRTRQTAQAVAQATGLDVGEAPGFAEVNFGEWDGFSFAEIGERWPIERDQWLASQDVAPPGGESFANAHERVMAALREVVRDHAGRTVVIATHVSPIKLIVKDILRAAPDALYLMELSPASVTHLVSWQPGGGTSLRGFNIVP
jgi:ribonuclease H / adenosylcobalamin/alpha-ribazole phosphatase